MSTGRVALRLLLSHPHEVLVFEVNVAIQNRVFCLLFLGATGCLSQTAPDGSADRVTPAPAIPPVRYRPMAETDRFRDYLKSTFSPVAFLRSGASAGYGLWRHKPEEWREGAEGFGQRYASSFAQHFTKETLQFGLSSALQEDNRFVPSGREGFGSRLAYAIPAPFLARRNDGTRRVSISRIAAFAGAAAISRLWQPLSDRTAKAAGVNFGASMGAAVGFDVLKEFWPRRQ